MGSPVPPVDLSGGKYDEFETMLSEKLGIKVILVRGWEMPDNYYLAEHKRHFTTTQEAFDKARAEFAAVENSLLGSLRANIADRDRNVGHDLSDDDLRSLYKVGHITLRQGNASPEEAVLIFDPWKSDAKRAKWNIKDVALDFAFYQVFQNAWDSLGDDNNRNIETRPFIENFQMDEEDIRRYQAVMNVKYALKNQSEYNNLGRRWYDEPDFYKFAGIAGEDTGSMGKTSELSFPQMVERCRLEKYGDPEDWGIKDPEFFDKLKLAGAVMALVSSITPTSAYATFARLGLEHQVTPQEIHAIQQRLHENLDAQLEKHKPGDKFFIPECDWRIRFPLFREVYEQDKSAGPEREYLDTIMEGLQKYFPNVTNGRVPDLSEESEEPPRRFMTPADLHQAFQEATDFSKGLSGDIPATKPLAPKKDRRKPSAP